MPMLPAPLVVTLPLVMVMPPLGPSTACAAGQDDRVAAAVAVGVELGREDADRVVAGGDDGVEVDRHRAAGDADDAEAVVAVGADVAGAGDASTLPQSA